MTKLLYKNCPLLFFIIVFFNQSHSQIVEGPTYGVLGVSVSCDGNLTRVLVETTRKPSGKVFYLSNPLRVVIDIDNANLILKEKTFPSLPAGLFMSFNIAQYKGGQKPIVRVVFKIASRIENFTQNALDNGLEIIFPTSGYPIMSWSTELKKAEEAKPAPEAEKPPTPVKPETIAAIAKPESIPPPPGEAKPFKREMVSFVYTGRDPFLPQAPTKEVPFGSKVYANVEALSLVGIVVEGNEKKALLEDKLGFGYLLGVGDSVENGYVKKIGDRDVTFQIEEFGWTRSVTLELPKEIR